MAPLGNFKGESETATQYRYRHYSINVQRTTELDELTSYIGMMTWCTLLLVSSFFRRHRRYINHVFTYLQT